MWGASLNIKRIDNYKDKRFSEAVLKQHGAFVVDDNLYEVEIISDMEAVVRGPEKYQKDVIEEFRFFAEHISKFYNEQGETIAEYASVELFDVPISLIQPSQFFVDQEKKSALSSFINEASDIVIPLNKKEERYVSLDGHTRLSIAVDKGYDVIKRFLTENAEWVEVFVNEAQKRGIFSPYDIKEVNHEEYDIKWNKFCDELFDKE